MRISPPSRSSARIVADPRSNSLIVTATAESFPVIESLITQLDEVPAVSPRSSTASSRSSTPWPTM
jgi:hypothetical protein